MLDPLLPITVLVVLPAIYFGHRFGVWRRPLARRAGFAVLGSALLLSLPTSGVDLATQKRVKLLIAAGMTLALALDHFGLGRQLTRSKGFAAGTLVVTAVVYLNFFGFHGERTWVQVHDVAHYYLGSKYYAEAGYSDLYTAMLKAEEEAYEGRFMGLAVRDLRTYDKIDIFTELEAHSDRVKAGFTAERWEAFKTDVAYFRDTLHLLYPNVLVDHGFNPTPVWALLGHPLANLVPAGSEQGLMLLTLLDLVLLATTFGAVGWAYGRRAVFYGLIYFMLIFGTSFGWTGGSFLRYPWLTGVVVGVCCLRRRRDATAGVLLGVAAMLRVFPVFFLVPIVLRGLFLACRRRALPRRQVRTAVSFAVTSAVLFGATGFLPEGYAHWQEFRSQMELHVDHMAPNLVGLTDVLAFQPGRDVTTREEQGARKERRRRIHAAQLVFLFLPILALVARLSRYQTDTGTAVLALPLIHSSLSVASYYSEILVLVAIWQRHSPRHLALLFAVETLCYSLRLFYTEYQEGVLFLYRSILLLFMYAALYLPALQREIGIRGSTPSSG